MGTGSAFNMKSFVCICLPFAKSLKTCQTYYQKIHKKLQQSITNRSWRPPGLSSGPLWAPKHPQRVPRDPQETPKRVPRGSKRVPREPKRVPNDTKITLKLCQRGPKEDLGIFKSENLLKH